MCVHVFGNSPSPAVATYGLRRIAQNAAEVHGDAVFNFVKNDFYVDDGLTSLSSEDDAVALLTNTQRALEEEGRLRFHKLVSNNPKVLEHFKEEDLAKALKTEDSPTERSLGLSWDLTEDCFVFQYTLDKKSCYTKRNVLSTINSLFDPLGFLSPFTICGKILLRDITSKVNDWDEPIPEPLRKKWLSWFESLQDLQTLRIPRTYFPQHVRFNPESELHVFCDASEKAIASVAFLKTVTEDGNIHVGYAFGKAKVAPKHGHTIPRLELCAAVLAVEITEAVSEELSISPSKITYYTDSKVVLGYLNNRTRRFYIYVENRVSRILRFSKPSQWLYIETSNNPADEGTRGMKPSELKQCIWLSGEPLLTISNDISANYQLQNPDDDVEVRPIVKSMKTDIRLGVSRFEKFFSWIRLILAVAVLIRFIRRFRKEASTADESSNGEESKSRAKECIIKQIQQESFSREIGCLTNKKTLLKDSHVVKLSPFLDERGILRVGGRLRKSQLAAREKNPILIPGRSHVASLIVRFYHEEIHHQGRHVTEGAVRSAGFWITGGKRMIAKLIHACVTCRKLRGKLTYQKMADLPVDRLTPAPPFTFVGVDVFGPWSIVTRRTRGGNSSSKRWAVLCTCLAVRAVHIEVIDEMSSSAFINAVRRFLAIRGKVKVFRSDRGTNFVGATDDLSIDAINVEDRNVKNFLDDTGTTWLFNPPHASHFGGVWERMIGVTRRILDAILLENKHKHLTHDVLCTFMAEVCAIVNARPIVPVSTDPDDPFILSPSVLLTQKTADSSVDTYQDLGVKDMYKAQWKCVQVLAETFWKKWRRDYLSGLQSRQVWQDQSEDIKEGDLVLLRDKSVVRNEWPVGLVETVYASDDGLVRKVAVKVIKDNKPTAYIRPIVELVKLLE
ncbi:uncharacterized protein LOC123532195 [Mercenaria mercenaria]|uniref:uncharacterized protein LOC123532195 n=1 Tax=Mercenaria mercenaria TaxID=6596 RepID=UPI00234F5970|nr:uncharacterized protein LOC123532195 [Mercenaria mercenaria]